MEELCNRDYFHSNEELIGLQRVIIVAADKNVQLGNWWRKTIVVHCGTVTLCSEPGRQRELSHKQLADNRGVCLGPDTQDSDAGPMITILDHLGQSEGKNMWDLYIQLIRYRIAQNSIVTFQDEVCLEPRFALVKDWTHG